MTSRSEVVVRPLGGDPEAAALARIVGWAFGIPAADGPAWFDKIGRTNLRVASVGRAIVGGLAHVPMGQWFGGRSVPMVGIAGVAVAPEHRGRAIALTLTLESLRELRRAGVALSALFPATKTLYRKAGFEQAGTRFELVLAPRELAVSERELPLFRLEDGHRKAVERVYTELARASDGYLDRSGYVWGRVRNNRDGTPIDGYGFGEPDALEGYLFITQKPTRGAHYDLVLTDVATLTPRAGRRLLSFLAEHRSLADGVTWFCGPADALLALLPEQSYRMTLRDQWMLRIVDVVRALEARGYPELGSARLDFEIHDADLQANAGRFRLEVEAGEARVVRGVGTGALAIDIRGLAALYSGYQDAAALVRMGLARADERSLLSARALFSGPAPCMPDIF